MEKSKEELQKEYLSVKLMLEELGDRVPPEISEEVNRNLQKAYKGLYVLLPAREVLVKALQELLVKQHPELKAINNPSLNKLTLQACDFPAFTAITSIDTFLSNPESVKSAHIQSEEKLHNLVKFFASPVEEPDNEEEAANIHNINNEKREFLDVINEVLFRYFEEQLNNLDTRGWQLIGIMLGYLFMVYLKRCYVLQEGLTGGIISNHPNIDYETLEKEVLKDCNITPENEWILKL
jgi:hypothetical protein